MSITSPETPKGQSNKLYSNTPKQREERSSPEKPNLKTHHFLRDLPPGRLHDHAVDLR